MRTLIILSLFALVGAGIAHAGDAEKGAAVFKKKCKICHTPEQGGKHKNGPNLFGVVGRKAGSTDFTKYQALKGVDWVWDEKSIDGWITNPKKFSGKKTKMTAKIKKQGEREDIIAYLKTLK